MANYVRAKELAERWAVHVKTVHRWRRRPSNPLPAIRPGRDYLFNMQDVRSWEAGFRQVNQELLDAA